METNRGGAPGRACPALSLTAYAAPCQPRGCLQRKVATYLPLSSFWNVRAHLSDSALKGSPAPTNSPNQKDFISSLCRAHELRFLFLMFHGLGALDKGFRGHMTHKFSNLLLALFRKLFLELE